VTARGWLALAAALLSAGAAVIHASVSRPHLEESVLLGLLFVASALAQAAWSPLVLAAPSRGVFAAGILGNTAIVVAWALSRTTGLPFGHEPWTAEPVGALDVAATAFEVGIVAASAILLAAAGASPRRPKVRRFAAVAAALVTGLTGTAFAATPNGAGGHSHEDSAPHSHATPHEHG
jgi:hypothetical protein